MWEGEVMFGKNILVLLCCLITLGVACQSEEERVAEKETLLVPVIDGDWWEVTGNPRDHKYATERQEPVDFAVWQAADGTWQMWSCFRKTSSGGEEGRTRFFYGWEGTHPADTA